MIDLDDTELEQLRAVNSIMSKDYDIFELLPNTIASHQAAAHCEIISGSRTVLLLDLDDLSSYMTFVSNFPLVASYYLVKSVEEWRSKSNNIHIRITLDTELPNDMMRVLLQALLGSDLKREAITMARIHNCDLLPCLLFKPVTAPATTTNSGPKPTEGATECPLPIPSPLSTSPHTAR